MANKLLSKNFLLRSISTAVLLPLMLYIIALGGVYFAGTMLLVGLLLLLELYKIFKLSKAEYPFLSILIIAVFGIASLYHLCLLRGTAVGAAHIYTLAILIWSVDIGAYIIGSLLQGPKLAPSISPSKTWSGAVGGILSAIIMLKCLYYFDLHRIVLDLNVWIIAVLAILTQAGDLLESKFKRYHKIKDSGNVIPGHGGILDRIDGILLTVLFYYYLFV